MKSRKQALEAELARQEAACDAATSNILEAQGRIAAHRAGIKSLLQVIAGQRETLAECRAKRRTIRAELRALKGSP
jgi:chromosome segregation ATPase